jgi:two-component system, sensor histidine kinase and response regulator
MNSTEELTSAPVEILIAEDSPTQAKRLQHILEQQGYHVTHAANGRLALEAARRCKPTLIITDVVMPEMDGYELCRRVKSDPSLGDTPIILVTTLSDPQDVIRGLECLADNFILKPYDERHLLGRVQFVLINRQVCQAEKAGMGVEIFFSGQKHFITADRLQILNLLLSTYDAAIQRNKDLMLARDDLRLINTRLEAANQELEAFTHTVSHDLRAPLRHISSYAKFLTRSDSSTLSEKDRGFLGHIVRSTERMSRLIDDLLAFSRMGLSDLRQVSTDPQSLLEEVFRQIEPEIGTRNIVWKKTPLPPLHADPALLRQVFINLLLNAIKYTRNRDPAEIEIGCRVGSLEEIVIFVRDNGAGFDMKYAGKLFGVFQRLHRQDEFEGTGVGLATVRRIIARHGGRTWAEGIIDGGATFYFTLPRKIRRVADEPQ